MNVQRKVEIFSAGCPACEQTIALVRAIACPSCDVQVLDMHDAAVASRAAEYGVRRVPAVAVDGKLADCCITAGVDKAGLRAAGVGVPL